MRCIAAWGTKLVSDATVLSKGAGKGATQGRRGAMKQENDPIVCIMSAQRRVKQAREAPAYSEYLDEAEIMLDRALVLVKELVQEIERKGSDGDKNIRVERKMLG